MLEIDLRNRFFSKYDGEINDPIINILLDTMEIYQKELQEDMLFSAYTSWNNELSDGFFEVLRRNMFSSFFPGPAYTVVHSRLARFVDAEPLFIDKYHHLSIQDEQGNKVFFSPHKPSWIVPNSSNVAIVKSDNRDLLIGFNIWDIAAIKPDVFLSVFFNNIDPLIIERLKCRISMVSGDFLLQSSKKSIFRTPYPLAPTTILDFFQTPYYNKFIDIPFHYFHKLATQEQKGDIVWLRFEWLAEYSSVLEKNITINAFTVWNLVEKEILLTKPFDKFRYRINNIELEKKETMISGVFDTGYDPQVEYFDRTQVMDPSYPYQFTTHPDQDSDAIIIAINPQTRGNLKVHYYQYQLDDSIINLAAGKTFTLYRGLDETIYSIQSILPTTRNEAFNDKKKIWEYFRSLIASRQRLITKEDFRIAIRTYPAFAMNPHLIDVDNISFNERTGRVRGFITTYTEITIPINASFLLNSQEKKYFEYKIGTYLKERTISGNYLSIVLQEK